VGDDGNPLDTLDDPVVSAGAGTEAENVDDRGRGARARTWSLASRGGTGADLKVSRAAEKLAHLISNGSFNNIPRRLLPGPPFLRAGYARINRALFPRRVASRRDATRRGAARPAGR